MTEKELMLSEQLYIANDAELAKDNAKARDAFKRAIVSNPTSQTTVYWSQLAGRAMDRLPAGK